MRDETSIIPNIGLSEIFGCSCCNPVQSTVQLSTFLLHIICTLLTPLHNPSFFDLWKKLYNNVLLKLQKFEVSI
jgi:hypothetical protein